MKGKDGERGKRRMGRRSLCGRLKRKSRPRAGVTAAMRFRSI